MITKVISGGQTGVDRMGLIIAQVLDIPTGGTAPKGWITELGPFPELGEKYGLVESEFSHYSARTERNVVDSDATVLFGNMSSTGSKQTIQHCIKHFKPYRANPTIEELVDFLDANKVSILNVAGNRGSKINTKDLAAAGNVLAAALKQINKLK